MKDEDDVSSFCEYIVSELLRVCCRDGIKDERDRLCGDARDFRGKGRRWDVAVEDVGCAERFEEVSVPQRCGAYDRRKARESGELDGYRWGIT